MARDHRIEIYLDGKTYLALRARVAEEQIYISQHVRRLIDDDLDRFSDSLIESASQESGGKAGEAIQPIRRKER